MRTIILAMCLFFGTNAQAMTLTKVDQIGAENSTHPCLAVDQAGNAVAVWTYSDGKSSYIYAATQLFNKTWSEPVLISNKDKKADYAKVVVDDRKHATAVWLEEGDGFYIHASRLTYGATNQWEPTEYPISDAVSDWSAPCLGIDKKGNVFATWAKSKDDKFIIQGVRQLFGNNTWDLLPESEQPYVGDYKLAVDRNGNIVFAWMDFHEGHAMMAATLPFHSNAWTVAKKLNDPSNPADQAFAPSLAVDDVGNVVVLWMSNDPDHGLKAASLPFKAKEWIPTQFPSCKDPQAPAIAFDAAGNALVVWKTSMTHAEDHSILCTTLRRFAKIWTIPVALDCSPYPGGDSYPNIATDRKGNTMVVWGNQCPEHKGPLYSNILKAGELNWSPLPYIICDDANTGTDPLQRAEIGLSNKGSFVVLFSCPGTIDPKAITLNAVGGFNAFQAAK